MGKIEVTWLPSPLTWIKINTNGASQPSSLSASCRGLLSDVNGNWLNGSIKLLSFYFAFQAKCWGVLCSLQIAWDIGFKKVHLECNSKALILTLKNFSSPHKYLLQVIKRLLNLS